ncbi:MAG: ketol-acid reductoisomerase [Nitrososphaeria archaeon]
MSAVPRGGPRIYYDDGVSLEPILSRRVAIIGYGSQGRAQALNLRDSGVDVRVGLRRGGRSWEVASRDGFEPLTIEDAVRWADVVQILIPDLQQPSVYASAIAPNLRRGASLGFAHAFNIHYGLIRPPEWADVFMVAPKSPGPRVREEYVAGRGVPSLVAVAQDRSGRARELALAYAKAIGSTRAGVLETTFREEVETDLFGEQAVLVGGVTYLILRGFETLVEAGYQPEVAYFEVLNELKLIVDLIQSGGLTHMLESVSETARYGGLTRGPRVIDERVKETMRRLLDEVRSGEFAREWAGGDVEGSLAEMRRLVDAVRAHQIEEVGARLRRLMRMRWGAG